MPSLRLFLLFLLFTLIAAPPLPAGFTEDLSYAEHLFDRAEYASALREYRRLLFLYPAPAAMAGVQTKTARAFFLSGNHEGLQNFLREENLSETPSFRYLAGLSAFRERKFVLSYERLSPLLSAEAGLSPEQKNFALLIQSANLATLEQIPDAQRLLSSLPPEESPAFEAQILLKSAVDRLSRTRRKSPALAAGLSLIPGLGLAYSGEWVKAGTLFSAGLLTGLAGWLNLRDRDWQNLSGKDGLDISLWSAGALLLILRGMTESYQAADDYNSRRESALHDLMMTDPRLSSLFQKNASTPRSASFSLAFTF